MFLLDHLCPYLSTVHRDDNLPRVADKVSRADKKHGFRRFSLADTDMMGNSKHLRELAAITCYSCDMASKAPLCQRNNREWALPIGDIQLFGLNKFF